MLPPAASCDARMLSSSADDACSSSSSAQPAYRYRSHPGPISGSQQHIRIIVMRYGTNCGPGCTYYFLNP